MKLKDITFFADLSEAIGSVAYLTGSQGKAVRRVLEAYFPNGICDVELAVPEDLSILAFAAYIDRVQQACHVATHAVSTRQQGELTYAVLSASLARRSYRLRIVSATVPTSMRDRQQFLSTVEFGIKRLQMKLDPSMHYASVGSQDLEEQFYLGLFAEDVSQDTPASRMQAVADFKSLVAGDFRDIGRFEAYVVHFASILNPAVEVAVRKYNAAAEQQLDEALESWDIAMGELSAKDRPEGRSVLQTLLGQFTPLRDVVSSTSETVAH